jgi:hypothetical protein
VRIYRVAVRGRFRDLTDEQRASLLAAAEDHDVVLVGAFTETGTLTYERRLHGFTYRVQMRAEDDEPEADVVARATEQAEARVAELGVHHRDLRAAAHHMADTWR